ncbi:MAG: aldehyde dehydrogenase family protein [Firmicutes bacterium]|nr:aldehyde dehydrogenase family protein [Bacillota bacterium]MCL5013213.1 aldehyde dehydrogenase family protein [Bacillota bacterium]
MLHALSLPPGVVNLITGDPEVIGPALVRDERVRKVSFTGSTAVGRRIMHNAADNITALSLELGGNAPFIVFDDADIEDAVRGIMACKFRNAGQICVAANRIYVQRPIAAKLTRQLVSAVTALRVGNGLEPDTQVGPLINQEALDKVSEHLHDAEEKGAQIVAGGSKRAGPGYFFWPTIVTQVNETMKLAREETFGPVAPLSIFDSEEDAFQAANDTPYGLSAYVYTRNLGRAMRSSQSLEFGLIGINDPVPSRVEAPIGGWKASGLGREGGAEGLDEFLETKYVSVRF